jgi:hypothetical protein
VTDLPNHVGWAVRIAGSDGGTLRATVAAVTELIEAGSCEGERIASYPSAVHQR